MEADIFPEDGLDPAHKAIGYCRLAGERALSQSAMVEAERHFNNALDLLAGLPEKAERDRNEFAIRMSIGSALFALKGAGTPQMESNYSRARELCARLGNPLPELCSILLSLWALNNARGETLKGYDFALQLLGKAQDSGDRSLLRLAENVVAYSLYWLGQFADSRNHFEAAAAVGDTDRRILDRS